MKKYMLTTALCLSMVASAFAQEEKLVIKPSGRILMDAATMSSSDETVNKAATDGMNIPEQKYK